MKSKSLNTDLCQYKRCYFPLGPWVKAEPLEGYIDSEKRTCEKCGGSQFRAGIINPDTINAINGLFNALKETK